MCKTVSVVFRGFLFLKNNTLNRKVHLSKLHWCGDVQEAYCACKLQTEDLAQTVTLCLALLNVNLIPFFTSPNVQHIIRQEKTRFRWFEYGMA